MTNEVPVATLEMTKRGRLKNPSRLHSKYPISKKRKSSGLFRNLDAAEIQECELVVRLPAAVVVCKDTRGVECGVIEYPLVYLRVCEPGIPAGAYLQVHAAHLRGGLEILAYGI